jgi:hypothetical protein
MLGHRVEVPVVVKKGAPFLKALGPDDHVARLAHRDASLPQGSVVASSLNRQALAEHSLDLELAKVLLDRSSMPLVAGALLGLG